MSSLTPTDPYAPMSGGFEGEGRHIGLPLRPGPDQLWDKVYGARLCVCPLTIARLENVVVAVTPRMTEELRLQGNPSVSGSLVRNPVKRWHESHNGACRSGLRDTRHEEGDACVAPTSLARSAFCCCQVHFVTSR